jgi:hypothetical protein
MLDNALERITDLFVPSDVRVQFHHIFLSTNRVVDLHSSPVRTSCTSMGNYLLSYIA